MEIEVVSKHPGESGVHQFAREPREGEYVQIENKERKIAKIVWRLKEGSPARMLIILASGRAAMSP